MPLSLDTYRRRLSDVMAAAEARGCRALAVFGMGSMIGPGSRTHGSLRYLCGWDSAHTNAVLVLRTGERPRLLVTNIFGSIYGRDHFEVAEVSFVPAPSLGERAAALCAETRRDGSGLGVIGRNEMPVPLWEGLLAGLPGAEWVDLTGEIERRRVVKSVEELEKHGQAAAIVDELFETLRREIRTPRPGFQLQADLERAARYAGCEFCKTWLTIAPEADYCRSAIGECGRTPQEGDQVLLGIYLMRDGFWGHAVRMGTFGRPTDAHRRAHAIASEMQDAMLGELQPGRDLNAVQRAADAVLARRLTDEERARLFYFRHAHGLGYSYEDPIVTAPFPQPYAPSPPCGPLPAEPGMLFEFHPNLFVPGLGGGAVGDMVVVTDESHRHLTAYPRDLTNWAA